MRSSRGDVRVEGGRACRSSDWPTSARSLLGGAKAINDDQVEVAGAEGLCTFSTRFSGCTKRHRTLLVDVELGAAGSNLCLPRKPKPRTPIQVLVDCRPAAVRRRWRSCNISSQFSRFKALRDHRDSSGVSARGPSTRAAGPSATCASASTARTPTVMIMMIWVGAASRSGVRRAARRGGVRRNLVLTKCF